MFDVDVQTELSKIKFKSLTVDQEVAFSTIMKAVCDETHTLKLFFLIAPGGYGITFLIEVVLATVRGMGKIALAVVASSGIATELLQVGRTAHSRFKIPIPVNETSVCNIRVQSDTAKLMRKVELIIWNEVIMSHVHQVDCVD